MTNILAKHGVSPEQEREMWRKQNIADLLYHCDLPFTEKLKLVEGMAEVARAFYHKPLPPSEPHPPFRKMQ